MEPKNGTYVVNRCAPPFRVLKPVALSVYRVVADLGTLWLWSAWNVVSCAENLNVRPTWLTRLTVCCVISDCFPNIVGLIALRPSFPPQSISFLSRLTWPTLWVILEAFPNSPFLLTMCYTVLGPALPKRVIKLVSVLGLQLVITNRFMASVL